MLHFMTYERDIACYLLQEGMNRIRFRNQVREVYSCKALVPSALLVSAVLILSIKLKWQKDELQKAENTVCCVKVINQ